MYIEIGYGKEDEITEQDVEMQLASTLETCISWELLMMIQN